MKRIEFYRTINGASPVEEFLETLDDNQAKKVLWVLRLIRELNPIPSNYFSKLVNTDDMRPLKIYTFLSPRRKPGSRIP
jgi:hypothetical protein